MSALEALAAALEELSARTASKAEFLPAARSVGEVFSQAARDRPEMFLRGNKFATTPEGLGQQFGTSGPLNYVSKDPDAEQLYNYFINANPKATQRPDKASLWGIIYSGPSMMKMQGFNEEAARAAGLVRPTGEYHSWDTMSSTPASGEGTRLYATGFGKIANNPDAYNFTEGLSKMNRYRRNVNMASALARDPSLGNRLIMAPSQLEGQAPLTVREYHQQLIPEEQLGALHLIAAKQALQGMQETVKRTAGSAMNPMNDAAKQGLAERALAGLNLVTPSALRADAPLSSLENLANAYRRAPMAASEPAGLRTLRKQALVRQILQGAKFDDLGEMFSGLEYRWGGRV